MVFRFNVSAVSAHMVLFRSVMFFDAARVRRRGPRTPVQTGVRAALDLSVLGYVVWRDAGSTNSYADVKPFALLDRGEHVISVYGDGSFSARFGLGVWAFEVPAFGVRMCGVES